MNTQAPRLRGFVAAAVLATFVVSPSALFATLDTTTFHGPIEFTTDRDPSAIAMGDLDGDGKLDLVTANYQSNTLGIYRNTSSPGFIGPDSFAPAVRFNTGPNPSWVVLADLDHDGKLDVILANDYGASISLFPNTSQPGAFDGQSLGDRIDLAAGTHPVGLAVADFDGDGWEDIAVANAVLGPSTVGVYRNLGAGTALNAESFAPMIEFATGDYSIKMLAGDLDGDGLPDLAVANIYSQDVSLLRNVSTSEAIQFAPAVSLSTDARSFECALGDLNGDGPPELVVTHDGGLSIFQNQSTAGALDSSSFAEAVTLPVTGTAYETELGDFDGDGDLDIVFTVLGQQGVSAYANLGVSGAITADSFGPKLDYGTDGNSVGIADLDGDGRLDVATCHMYRISVYWNTGSVPTPPRIIAQPQSQGAMPGQTVVFRVGAVGTDPLTYQWLLNDQPIEGANNPSHTITNVRLEDAGDYSVVVANALGTETSRLAHLSVVPAGSLAEALDNNLDWMTTGTTPWVPGIDVTHDGEDAVAAGAVCCGESSQLHTSIRGPAEVTFWWRHDSTAEAYSALTFWIRQDSVWLTAEAGAGWQPIQLTVGPGTHTLRWSFYREGLLNPNAGGAWLDEVIVTPRPEERPPIITQQPASQIRFVGGDAQFDVEATGESPLEYQWYYNDSAIAGATASTLTVGNVQPEQAGEYWVVITNPHGSTTSQHALLTVRTAMPIPTITSITPLSARSLEQLTINGQNFSANASDNIVYLGAVRASVTEASAETLQVIVPVGATFAPVTVTVNGYTAWSAEWFVPSFGGAGELLSSAFEPVVEFPAEGNPSTLAFGDLDGDGKPEMVTATYQNNTLAIYKNVSSVGSITTDSFAAPVRFATPANPAWVALADLNNDGKLDIVVANDYGANISVFQNLSSPGVFSKGSLGPRTDFAAGTHPVGLAVADFDGDGWTDIAVANASWDQSTIGIFQNVGTTVLSQQSFAPMAEHLTGYYTFKCTAGDLDGDGKPDLAVANIVTGDISVLRNNSALGSISFQPAVNFSTGTRNFECAIGDLDSDGKAELVVVHDDGFSIFKNQAEPGTFTSDSLADRVLVPVAGTAYEIELADLNGDKKLDLVLSILNQPAVSIYQNRALSGVITEESFGPKTDLPTDGNSIALGDLDADERPEVVTAHDWRISVHRNIMPIAARPPDSPGNPPIDPPVRLSAEEAACQLGSPVVRDGKIYFVISGAMAKTVVIEASVDLVHWTTLTVVPDGSANIVVSDPSYGTLPQRFYRARLAE